MQVEQPPRITFAFENADIQKVIDTIAKISGANIVVAPQVQGNITLEVALQFSSDPNELLRMCGQPVPA